MNKFIMQVIYNCLSDMKKGLAIDKNGAICDNLYRQTPSQYLRTIDDWLNKQFEIWPECHVDENGKKDTWLPVGGKEELRKETYQGTLWQNHKRLRLLDFLIEQAETQLSEMNKGQQRG